MWKETKTREKKNGMVRWGGEKGGKGIKNNVVGRGGSGNEKEVDPSKLEK